MNQRTINGSSNERSLLESASRGDSESFEKLFLNYYTPLLHYIFKITKDHEVSQDIIQEVFLKLWHNRETLYTISSFKDYLFILTKNRVLNVLKDNLKKSSLFCSYENLEAYNVKDELPNDISYKELAYNVIEQEIEKLPPQQRSVFKLAKLQKLSYVQVSEKLSISVETVRKHLYLAQRALREQVKNREKELYLLISILYFF